MSPRCANAAARVRVRFPRRRHGRVISIHDGVRFRRARQIDRRLRKRKQTFGQADELNDVGGGRGLDHRLRIGEADVFGSENAETPRDEDRIGAAFDHARQPVKRGVHIGIAQRLDQR